MNPLFHIQWHITNLCNLRCRHCYQDDFSKKNDLDGPTLEKVLGHFLDTLREWDQTATIHLTGGEPLLKPELFDLLGHLDRESVIEELGIITNGLLVDREVLRRLSAFSKLKKIKVSLDGANAETNDSIRPKGTFEKVIRNLSLIKETGRFEMLLMFTVMRRNFKELPSFYQLSKELGANGFIIERFIPWGRGKERMDEVLSKEDWRELIRTLLNSFSIEEERSFLPYQAFQVSFVDAEPELLGAPCVVGKDGMCIMPNGEVFPCRRFPVSIGNLLLDSLKTIWETSTLLKKVRQKENLKGKCGSCEIQECLGCRSLTFALTHDYLGEDPHCWYPDNEETTHLAKLFNPLLKN